MDPASYVLYVEDDPDDFETFRDACARYPSVHIHQAIDGTVALGQLTASGKEAANGLPCLILLDLNLPGMRGDQVLEALKADDAVRHIPVVIMTTSGRPSEVHHLMELGCDGYFIKPDKMIDVTALAEQLIQKYCPGAEPSHEQA